MVVAVVSYCGLEGIGNGRIWTGKFHAYNILVGKGSAQNNPLFDFWPINCKRKDLRNGKQFALWSKLEGQEESIFPGWATACTYSASQG